MKNYFIISFALVVIGLNPIIHAQVTLNPGSEYRFSDNPAHSGSSGNNGNFSFIYAHDHNIATKTIRASVDGSVTSAISGRAFAQINYDFEISQTSVTMNNTVGAWISYDVSWLGRQLVLEVLGSNANVNVELILRDVTENKVIYRDIIHDLDVKTRKIKIVNIGFDFNDSGSRVNIFPAVLNRGHTYRLTLRLTAEAFRVGVLVVGSTISNYFDLGGGAVLNDLYIKVGLDEKETLEKLAKIDLIAGRVDTLEHKLENHYHTYLTGRGVGHNNTEAQTTLSIFDIENPGIKPPVFLNTAQLKLNEDLSDKVLTPEDFSLMQNHPNPFNPTTKISFALPEQEIVSIKVYDILGQLVTTLLNEIKPAGNHEVIFDAVSLPSGTYIYEIHAGDYSMAKKMILLK